MIRQKSSHTFIMLTLWVLVGWTATVGLMPFIPLSWVVDHKYVKYADVCVGDDVQSVTTNRYVPFALSATSTGEVHKITDGIREETTIRRHVDFVYQKTNETIVYIIEWDTPFQVAGVYEALQFIEVNLGLITISGEAPRGRFKVINCGD